MGTGKYNSKIKKSFVLGGLVGTSGLFLAKALGLVYSIPFSNILGSDAYMSYYGTSYRIYNYLLNIFTAGIPFAIASLVAKYLVKDDYKSVLRIKKISITMLTALGFAGMLLMILFAQFIPYAITTADDVFLLKRALMLLSLAVFFVPILAALRGYYQGQKEMSQYAFSQVFEQFFRVGFLLGCSYLFVYVWDMERKWALYISVLSTSIAAIAAILQYLVFDNKKSDMVLQGATQQREKGISEKELRKELITLAIPYLLLIPIGLRMHGYTQSVMDTILSAINYVGPKLNSIPLILAPGFVAALIPYMSEALGEGDYKKLRKYVTDCLQVVLYISFPIAMAIIFYADGVYHTLFFTDDAQTSVWVLRCIAIEGAMAPFGIVIANMMVTLGMGKEGLRRMGIQCALKIVLIVPLIYLIGYIGIAFATIVGTLYIAGGNLKQIKAKYQVDFSHTVIRFVQICIAIIFMWVVHYLLRKAGLDFVEGPRMICFMKMFVNGIITAASYLVITWCMKIPQSILEIRRRKA